MACKTGIVRSPRRAERPPLARPRRLIAASPNQADVLAELELVLTPEYFSQMCADPHFHNKEL